VSAGKRFDELLGRRVDLRALVVLRRFVGVIALVHLWPIVHDARHGFIYRDAFYQPYASWYPELPRSCYIALLGVGCVAAIAMAVGVASRVATVVTFVVVAYDMFLSTTNVHNNRAYLVVVLGVLTAVPAGRDVVAPGWPLWLLRFEAAVVYGASGLSKLLDPDWFGGVVAWQRVTRHRAELVHGPLPEPIVSLLTNRSFEGVAAKIVIATELCIAIGLWSRRTRYAAVWIAVVFHVAIEVSASVEVFSALAIAALLVWAVPSTRDRVIVLDPARDAHWRFARAVRALDWLARFRFDPRPGATFTVIDRDGSTRRGGAAGAFVCSRLPLTAWFALPVAAVLGRSARSDRGGVPRFVEQHVDAAR
jgi:hypothetical protein